MSFSSDIKEELSRVVTHEECCMMAELTGFLITNCNIVKEKGEFTLRMSTENAAAIKRVYTYFKKIYGVTPISNVEKEKTFKENLYQLRIVDKDALEEIFKNSYINIDVKLQIVIDKKEEIKANECCIRSFLRGVFIGAGSMTNPTSRYHLEIVANSIENATFISELITEAGINAKTIKRKRDFVIYIKGAEDISNFLALIGSNKGMLAFEETRVLKDMRNRVNRLNNFENANFDKTVDAGLSQIADIEVIKHHRKFEKLPDGLKQLAKLRFAYREATLEELGNMLEPKLSRAGVSHRFKKIRAIADELRKKE